MRPTIAWIDGEFVAWDEARIHVRTEAVMRGVSVFEGIRAYRVANRDQLLVFRLEAHLQRLRQSMRVLRLPLPYEVEELGQALLELIRRCGFHEDIHIRPTVYAGEGQSFGYTPEAIQVGAFITAIPMPQTTSLETGIAVCVSSWQRIADYSIPPRVKAAGNYLNSRLAHVQASVDGYDEAILLDSGGKVSETTGSCLMLVRGGRVITPRVTDSILESITRATLIRLLEDDLGIEVVEREIDRTELYMADEIFECGSGHEVRPIISVDRVAIGSGRRGATTQAIQEAYFDVVRGKIGKYGAWLTPVYEVAGVTSDD